MTTASLSEGLSVQRNVIGALILREIHTRYGRDNVGYLWLFLEPAILAAMVALIHIGGNSHLTGSIGPIPFALLGYTTFIMFRSIFTRADAVLETNAPLLYHRQISIFDMVLARALLELASTIVVLAVLFGIATLAELAHPPERPLALLAGIGLLWWWSLALSFLICAATNENRLVTKFVHPISYILLPISGAFYMLDWLPRVYRDIMAWFPMTQMFELIRYGMFAAARDDYVQPIYIIFWCMLLTFLGLLSIRAVRRHVHIG
jgi:capsular polysaccharide transport system permease protein|tara:strand:+ start:67347 stop:68135 length:789 start_codon:yes stop_codon:yes gene_type:complete